MYKRLALIFVVMTTGALLAWGQSNATVDFHRYTILWGGGNETTIECPNHAFGSMEDGLRVLKERLAQKPPNVQSFAQLCVSQQDESLKMYTPFMDAVAINPFVSVDEKFDEGSPLWPDVNHPVINRLRKVRELAGKTPLLARIDLYSTSGEGQLFAERQPSIEEVEWMALATIGADYDGIVWCGAARTPDLLRPSVESFERRLMNQADELSKARPFMGIEVEDGVPVAGLISDRFLFVIVLNPDYLNRDAKNHAVLPLAPRHRDVVFRMSPSNGLEILAGHDLSGNLVNVQQLNGTLTAQCVLRSGGSMIVFPIEQIALP